MPTRSERRNLGPDWPQQPEPSAPRWNRTNPLAQQATREAVRSADAVTGPAKAGMGHLRSDYTPHRMPPGRG